MSELVAIVNPAAGGGRCGRHFEAALSRLRRAGIDIDVRRTSRALEATDIARQAYASGARRFLAVGGDGTSFEIVNGIFPRPDADRDAVTLGMLPLGTGNSFLRDFGIKTAEQALDALEKGATRSVDVVRVTHASGLLHYINILSIGFSARAGALTNRRFKPLGPAGYVLAVFACIAGLRHPRYSVRLDDGGVDRRPCALLSFSNSRFTGGTMMMAPTANPSDGMLDVIRVGELGRLQILATFPKIFSGTHVGRPGIEHALAKAVAVEGASSEDVMVDGEIVRLELQRLDVMHQALEVIA